MITEIGSGAAMAAATSFAACRLLIAAGLVDVPNEARKAHGKPTPTSGGIGIALGFALGMLTIATSAAPEWRVDTFVRASLATGFAVAFMLLGFFDDARPMGPRTKFGVFALLSLGSTLSVGVVRALPISEDATLQLGFPLGLFGSALFVFTLVNCVNFMDGANGLAMGSVAIGLTALAVIALEGGASGAASLAACGAAALLGFLFWNFPGARLFAGDSGALFAGALAALVSLLVVHRLNLSPFIPPILFFPLLADVLLTLAWRVQRRRSVLSGHAEHLYQIGRRSGLGHVRVTLIYWAAMIICGVIAYAAEKAGPHGPPLALASLAIVSLLISASVRKHALARNMGEV